MKTLRGRKALVTGAASGIGRSIALALAREGVDLFLIDVDRPRLEAAAGEARALGAEVIDRVCDLAHADQITDCVDQVTADWGCLHILVNNAGILYYDTLDTMTMQDWDQVLAVNLLAPVRLIHLLLPLLRGQDEAHILNICSVAGLVPKRRLAAYATSKFGLAGLSLSLRAELGPDLGVTVVCPGFVDTRLFDAARDQERMRMRRNPSALIAVSPDKVAARALAGIRKDRAIVMVTAHARLLWYLYRFTPWLLDAHQRWKNRRRQRRSAST